MEPELERKLRDLLDRDAIWQVLLRYARGLDRMDNDMTRACYWPDAIEDHGHYLGGVEGFVGFANMVTQMFSTSQHWLMNHTCELDGDDAHCETYHMFTGVSAEAPHMMTVGRYVDHFQRRGGEWRIFRRVCVTEARYALADMPSGPSAYKPGDRTFSTRDRSDVSYDRPLVTRSPPAG